MHSYSTDTRERRVIAFFIAAAAIGASIGIGYLLTRAEIAIPGWVSPLDALTFYGMIYWLFDVVIWKWSFIGRIRISRLPDLSGVWQGYVTTTRSGSSAPVNTSTAITMTIRQTWTRLSIRTQTAQSSSRSLSANMIVSEECTLSYEYHNEPGAGAPEPLHAHRGLATLSLKGDKLHGEYFSGRDRQNIGTIEVMRRS